MADGGPPAPPAPQPSSIMPTASPVQLPVPPVKLIASPAQLIPTQPIQPALMPELNWSQFKSEYAGKPDEHVEAHFLRTNNWMGTCFPRRCQSPAFLSNNSRRSKIMVQIIKTYKCILEWVTKSVLAAIFQNG